MPFQNLKELGLTLVPVDYGPALIAPAGVADPFFVDSKIRLGFRHNASLAVPDILGYSRSPIVTGRGFRVDFQPPEVTSGSFKSLTHNKGGPGWTVNLN
jgi:hypothetical protein